MAINPKQKAELERNWNAAEEAGGSGIADGTYQFKIVKAAYKNEPKPCFKTTLEVTAGADDMIGESLEVNDNLETSQNMGWFKSKLARLNVSLGDLTFDDIENGTLGEQLKGKVFEGQAKTKGGFLNVYVNRLIGEGAEVSEEESSEEDVVEEKKAAKKGKTKEVEQEEVDESDDAQAFEEGDQVTWNGKVGEVVEVEGSAGDGLVRVKKDEDGSIVRVKIGSLKKVTDEAEEEEEESEEKEEGEEEQFALPDVDEVADMSAKDVKEALKKLDIDASAVKNPRGVLSSFCALANDPAAKIELSEMVPLATALEVKLVKGASFKDQLKSLSKAVQAKMG